MAKKARDSRLEQLAKASIIGTHAYQVMQAAKEFERKGKVVKVDAECYSPAGLTEEQLKALVAHQAALLHDDTAEIDKWADGKKSSFDPAKDVEPLLAAPFKLSDRLPVNVFAKYLKSAGKGSAADVLAVANLYQTCLEMERDGNVLWDEMHFYRALNYKTYVGEFGLPGTDKDLLAVGKKLAPLTCESPFGDSPTEAFAWQIAGRKIWNWGEKYKHIRDQYTIAKEMLAEPDIRVLVPKIRSAAPMKIATIGYSHSMQSHWTAAGAFVPIVTAIFQLENPDVVVKQWTMGGLRASRARKEFYESALAWKPDVVLYVLTVDGEQGVADTAFMTKGFVAAGAKVYAFDDYLAPSGEGPRKIIGDAKAKEMGLEYIEVEKLIRVLMAKENTVCLDGIHLLENWHRLMAKEWLKFLIGARGTEL